MNLKTRPLITASLLLLCNAAFAQSPVSVNPLTGTAGITIPVYTVSSGQVSVPVYLQYTGSGVRIKDVEGTAGMSWNLYAGGQISRVVRGLPDDCTADSLNNTMYGWMATGNAGATFAATFAPQNDNSFATCTDESNDISSINTYVFPYNDTEPDLFYVSAPGLSCELVYDRATAAFHPVSYQDLVIQITQVTASGKHLGNITQFTITNDKGITYVFAKPDMVTQTTVLGSGGTATYFNTKYQQYQHAISYAAAWNLVSITDPYNNAVNFNYTIAPARNSTDPVLLYIGGSSGTSVQYYVQQKYTPQTLSTIGTSNNSITTSPVLTFSWQTFNATHQSGQTAIYTVTGMGHTFQFNYTPAVSTNSSGGFTRNFLASYTDAGCGSPVNYQFSYVGQTYSAGTYYTALPDSGSTYYDYWGYYSTSAGTGSVIPYVYVFNPATTIYPRYAIDVTGSPGSGYSYLKLGNNSLQVTPSTVATGSLNKIIYPQGGSSNLVYESNDYYDPPSTLTVQGGGIRVKQIIDSVGTGSTNNMVRTYTYTNPGTTTSSGAPITLPQYAFTVPYSGSATGTTLYTDVTAISPVDLSTEDHTIMYQYVTLTQTGAGKTVNTYSVPYTYWSTGFGTVEDVARYNCSSSYGPMANFSNWYPFIPNPNYDFERGVPVKSVNYNDAGTEISETNYTYQAPSTPNTITAFRGEDNGGSALKVKSYNVYPIYFNTTYFPASVNTIVYDSQSQSTSQSTTVNYTYGSAYHKLLTQMQTTNSDGTILNSYYSYAKDFPGASVQSNVNITAVYNLIQQNINAPIESYTQVTPPGGSATTTNASLTYFRDTTINSATCVIPAKVFKWVVPNGGTFTPLVISGSTMTRSTNYFAMANYDIYDKTGYPLTVDDNYRHFQTTVLDHFSGKVTAAFKNANYSQVAFNDFDSDPGTPLSCNFTFSGSQAFTPTTAHAGNAYGLGSTQTATSPSIKKNSTAVNYIFSIWTNAASGTLTVTAGGNTYPITLSGSTWKYNEISIPASGLSSPFTITFASTANVAIDDVLLYPDCAEASTVTYDAVQHHKLAETNTNGVSSYFTYDQWGRLLFQFDQDKNIVLAKAYVTPGNISDFTPSVHYTPATGITKTTSVAFSPAGAGDPCTAAANVYTWKFGDGSSPVVTTSATAQNHTYTTPGTYQDTLVVTSDYFPTKTVTASIYVTAVANVPLHYIDNCTSLGDITTVTFSQGGVQKYSFSVSQLNSSTVVPGVYSITVNMNSHDIQYNSLGNGAGYQSVELLGANAAFCYNYSSSGTFTFFGDSGVDLTASTGLTFEVNTTSCP